MRISLLATLLLAAYVAASIGYVYRWRGRARYASFAEYLRSGSPLLAPFNCLCYLATRRHARQPVLDAGYLSGVAILRERWAQIRDEAIALQLAGESDARTAQRLIGRYQLAFRRFSRRDWRTFYLKWHGAPHRSARRLCPESVRLLEQIPAIRTAMFCVLPSGAELGLQSDATACSLRYHLGLETPGSERCFINVDGISLSWHNGRDFVLDCTYPHYARNATGGLRLILLCDVERPMNRLGRLIGRMHGIVCRALAQPNTAEDRRGVLAWLPAARAATAHHAAAMGLKLSSDALLVVAVLLLVYQALAMLEAAAAAALRWLFS